MPPMTHSVFVLGLGSSWVTRRGDLKQQALCECSRELPQPHEAPSHVNWSTSAVCADSSSETTDVLSLEDFRMSRVPHALQRIVLALLLPTLALAEAPSAAAGPTTECPTIRTSPGSVSILTAEPIPASIQLAYDPTSGEGTVTLQATELSTGDLEEKSVRFGPGRSFAGLQSVIALLVPEPDTSKTYMMIVHVEALVEMISDQRGRSLSLEINSHGAQVQVRVPLGSGVPPVVDCLVGTHLAPRFQVGTFPYLLGLASRIESVVTDYNVAQEALRALRIRSNEQQAEIARVTGESLQFQQIVQQQTTELRDLNNRIAAITSESDGLRNLVGRYELLVTKLQSESGKVKQALERHKRIYEMLAEEAFRLIRNLSRGGLQNSTEVVVVKGLSRTLKRLEQFVQEED